MDFPALIAFLAELARHNDKPWFAEHRLTHERQRGEWQAFVGQVIAGIAQFDPSVAPKDALFRTPALALARRAGASVNRDVRFAKDKRPYKTTFSAAICPQGRNSGLPVYYCHITETGKLLVAGGVYMPEPAILGQIRQHIGEHPEQLAAVLAEPAFAATFGTLEGERLKRPPQGYAETTPGIEFIKLKSFTAGREPPGWLACREQLADEIVATCCALFPLIRWRRAALVGSSDLGYLSPQEVDRLAGLGS